MTEPMVSGIPEPARLTLQGRAVACRAIIFDKDGTLVDPTGYQSRLTRLMALRAATQMTRRGPSVEAACSQPSQAGGKQRTEAAYGAPAGAPDPEGDDGAGDGDEWPAGPQLLPGVVPMLDAFQRLGLRLAVATGDRGHRAQEALDALGVGGRFAAVVSIDDVLHGKPAPDMVLVACELLGCLPSEAIVVGDSPADLMMGRAAGVAACIGVSVGFTASANLRALADVVLPTVAELPSLFETAT